jgi:hypothetical protein
MKRRKITSTADSEFSLPPNQTPAPNLFMIHPTFINDVRGATGFVPNSFSPLNNKGSSITLTNQDLKIPANLYP